MNMGMGFYMERTLELRQEMRLNPLMEEAYMLLLHGLGDRHITEVFEKFPDVRVFDQGLEFDIFVCALFPRLRPIILHVLKTRGRVLIHILDSEPIGALDRLMTQAVHVLLQRLEHPGRPDLSIFRDRVLSSPEYADESAREYQPSKDVRLLNARLNQLRYANLDELYPPLDADRLIDYISR